MGGNPVGFDARMVHPLDEFYAASGKPLPHIEIVDGNSIPKPCRKLLVHLDDMTPTLEKFHGGSLHLEVLGRRLAEKTYYREVILRLDKWERPVEFGAIKINLDRFGQEARAEILREHLPLGHILQQYNIKHSSRPSAFLKLKSDELIGLLFDLKQPCILYGRRNTLFDASGEPLAEVVEILPEHDFADPAG
jgi:chorismate-pyruvate lyase